MKEIVKSYIYTHLSLSKNLQGKGECGIEVCLTEHSFENQH